MGEIEAALRTHERVRDTLVTVHERGDQKQLLGYVIPRDFEPEGAHEGVADVRWRGAGGAAVASGGNDWRDEHAPALNAEDAKPGRELQEHLQALLPAYMVPAAIFVLESWPRTASGKVDHRALPAPDGSPPKLDQHYAAPRTDIESELVKIWCDVLGLPRVGVHDNFFQLGGDSILSIQIIARASQIGLRLTPRQLFEHQTVAALAAVTGTTAVADAEQGEVVGEVTLTPIQRWFFAGQGNQPHFNQSVMLKLSRGMSPARVRSVIEQLLRHHDALRMRFKLGEDGWRQYSAAASEQALGQTFTLIDLSSLTAARDRQERVLAEVSEQVQRSLDLERGPLLRVVMCELGAAGGQRLLIVVHHLVIDGVSWRILLEDLHAGLEQAARGQSVSLGLKTTSFREWAQKLAQCATSAKMEAERDYWEEQERGAEASVPVDYAIGENEVCSEDAVEVELSAEETGGVLREVTEVYRTQINEVLLVALSEALRRWTGRERVKVWIEGHGREAEMVSGADVTRTVGWFTTQYPVVLECGAGTDGAAGGDGKSSGWRVEERIKAIKEEVRRIPGRGIGYGLLKYMGRQAQQERNEAAGGVSFNYLGQFDQVMREEGLLQIASESSGRARSDKAKRGALVEITGRVGEGRLRMKWSYSRSMHRREMIERVAKWFMDALRDVLAKSRSGEVGAYTPSDFPSVGFSQEELDDLMEELRS